MSGDIHQCPGPSPTCEMRDEYGGLQCRQHSGRGNMEVEANVAVSLDLGISLGGEATNDETGGLGSNHGLTVTETTRRSEDIVKYD